MLGYFEENILKMNYEEIIRFLNELHKTEFYNNPEIVRLFKLKYEQFHLTKSLLEKLEKEHTAIEEMSNQCKVIEFDTSYGYVYCSNEGKFTEVKFAN